MDTILDFEQPIYDLERKIEELEAFSGTGGVDLSEEIGALQERCASLKQDIFSSLEPWQIVQLARHPDRPMIDEYIYHAVEDFIELHGDRAYGDDKAILTGLGRIGGHRVMIVGHRFGGKSTRDRQECNFGMPRPEGYRKALSKMQFAARLDLPIVTVIHTKGADCTIGAEERGQAWLIARNLADMARLPVPIVGVVIGEGGSGGALGIGLVDHLLMFEYSYYSVITPEGCAAILYRDSERWRDAAQQLRLTASDLSRLEIVDDILPEPVGGAHRAPEEAARTFKEAVVRALDRLHETPRDALLDRREAKYRRVGFFVEDAAELFRELGLDEVEEPSEIPPPPGAPPKRAGNSSGKPAAAPGKSAS